jgi:glucokinase
LILAGDIGGTKTNLALFEPGASTPASVETFRSREQTSLDAMVEAFLAGHSTHVDAACFGVAGPVRNGNCVDATNLAWDVDASRLERLLGLENVGLLNDLEANAWGISGLSDDDFAVMQPGEAERGNAAVISAGTGLGEAGLYWDGRRHRPFATEGGHVDFGPRNELEVGLSRFLAAEHGHVSYERVCSGIGIENIHRFLLQEAGAPEPAWLEQASDRAAAIANAAAGGDELADRTLDVFCSIYGAAAGNVALKHMATAGVFVGGGIAPKLLPRLREGPFVEAFRDKGRLRDLLCRIPLKVILNEQTALLGASLYASARST